MLGLIGACLFQTVELQCHPKLGDTTRYRSEWKLVNGPVTTEMSSEQSRTVTKVWEDGRYVVHTVSGGTTMKAGGRTVRDDQRTELDVVIGPRGNIVQFMKATGIGLPSRIAGFSCFISPTEPVSLGATWSVKRAGTADGLAESQLDYAVGKIGKNEATVLFGFKELGGDRAEGKGTWVFDTVRGVPRSLEVTLSGFHTGLGDLVWYRSVLQ